MIKNNEPLSMSEANTYVEKSKNSETDIVGFIKKFAKLKPEKAIELRKELSDLDLVKVNPKHISKIIDLMPEEKEELGKIFVDIRLNENETNKILEIIKKFK